MSWQSDNLDQYIQHTQALTDSYYLRERLLKPEILKLIGSSPWKKVLDIGAGDGWVLKALRPSFGAEVDIPTAEVRPFLTVQDVRALAFRNSSFDLVVASMSLMWFPEIEEAARETYRVAEDGGVLVFATPHPYGYRTGEVDEFGNYQVYRKIGDPFVIPDLYIAGTVGSFTYYHRPITHYFNAFLREGWNLEAFSELSINMAEYNKCVKASKLKRADKYPLFMVFKYRKAMNNTWTLFTPS